MGRLVTQAVFISTLGVAALLGGCASSRTQTDYEQALRVARAPDRRLAAAADREDENEDAMLGREANLDRIVARALARNPDLDEARLRVEAGLARVPTAGRWPDLEWKQEVGGLPLAHPWRLDHAQMLTFGVRQTIPAPGTLEARARAALEDARLSQAQRDARAQELAARTRRVYFEYFRAGEERRVLLEQLSLLGQMVELTRIAYRAGRGGQQDILRLTLEQARLRSDLALVDQQVASSRVVLNALMDRRLDAALGPVPEPRPETTRARLEELERQLASALPEVAAARAAIRRSEAALAGARAGARWPSFMIGADYWLMMDQTEMTNMAKAMNLPLETHRHGIGAMLSFNLPWFSRRRRDEVREAERVLAADRRALDATLLLARQQLRDAALRYEAARKSLAIIEGQVLSAARRNMDSAQAGYSAAQTGDALGLLDALRSYLGARLERARAIVRLQVALVDLERAAGRAAPRRGGEKETGR